MTRYELLHLLIAQARANGFEFRKWYVSRLGLPWQSTRQAVETLAAERRYYALLFSHDFASNFWKPGSQITFQVPSQTFTRRKADGTIATVTRKAFTRRSARNDAWLYHLRELAASEEPLRTMRKYLRVEDDLEPDPVFDAAPDPHSDPAADSTKPAAARPKPAPAEAPRPAPKLHAKPTSAGISLVRNRLT